MSAKNNCSFTANLGRDAEQRFTSGGKAILSFSIPVESGWGERKKTTWLRCSAFGKKAEGKLVDYLKKGQNVTVIGEVCLSTYEKDGLEKTSFEMSVDDLSLNGRAENTSQEPEGKQYGGAQKASDPFDF